MLLGIGDLQAKSEDIDLFLNFVKNGVSGAVEICIFFAALALSIFGLGISIETAGGSFIRPIGGGATESKEVAREDGASSVRSSRPAGGSRQMSGVLPGCSHRRASKSKSEYNSIGKGSRSRSKLVCSSGVSWPVDEVNDGAVGEDTMVESAFGGDVVAFRDDLRGVVDMTCGA